ncbi:MAG: hypothetical protein AB7R89_03735 [Dehalococcoidia bacterium]
MDTRLMEQPEQTECTATGPGVWTIAGLLLALVLLAGIGIQRFLQDRDGYKPAVPPVMAMSVPRMATAGAVEVLTVYVVGSEEHAASVQVAQEEANSIRHAEGEPPLRYVVVVVSPANAEAVLAAIWDDARMEGADGISLQVVDLRVAS